VIDEAVQVNDQEMITMLYHWLSMMACWWELISAECLAAYKYALENKGRD